MASLRRPPIGLIVVVACMIAVVCRFSAVGSEYWGQFSPYAFSTCAAVIFVIASVPASILAVVFRIRARRRIKRSGIEVVQLKTVDEYLIPFFPPIAIAITLVLALWPAPANQNRTMSRNESLTHYQKRYNELEVYSEPIRAEPAVYAIYAEPRVGELKPWPFSFVTGFVGMLFGLGLLFLDLRLVNEAEAWFNQKEKRLEDLKG